jgi:GNAT superfamily N-acetyltransferase
MSDSTSIEPGPPSRPGPASPDWTIRSAVDADGDAVAAAVERLLGELGGGRPSRPELEAEVRAALADSGLGALIVAEASGEIVGVLSASWQRAIHVPGRYATIQDLWVDPDWRSRGIGAELIEAIADLAREQGVARIEVGLPRQSFAAIGATEAFYRDNGFEHLGPRLRRLLP